MVTKKELYKQAKAIKSKNCPAISRYSKRQLNLFIIVKGKKAKPDKNLKIMPVKAPPKAPPKAQKKNLNPPVVIKQPKQSKQSKDKPTKAKTKKENPLSYDKWNDVVRGGTGNKKGYDTYLKRF